MSASKPEKSKEESSNKLSYALPVGGVMLVFLLMAGCSVLLANRAKPDTGAETATTVVAQAPVTTHTEVEAPAQAEVSSEEDVISETISVPSRDSGDKAQIMPRPGYTRCQDDTTGLKFWYLHEGDNRALEYRITATAERPAPRVKTWLVQSLGDAKKYTFRWVRTDLLRRDPDICLKRPS